MYIARRHQAASSVLPHHLTVALTTTSNDVGDVIMHIQSGYGRYQAQGDVGYSSVNVFNAALRVFNKLGERQLQNRYKECLMCFV